MRPLHSTVEERRKFVADKTRYSNRLTAHLKAAPTNAVNTPGAGYYFPQPLNWFGEVSDVARRHRMKAIVFPSGENVGWISHSTPAAERGIVVRRLTRRSVRGWRGDGQELFYATDRVLFSVEVHETAQEFRVLSSRPLFQMQLPSNVGFYDVTRDGKRFLVNMRTHKQESAPLTVDHRRFGCAIPDLLLRFKR